MPAPLTYPGVYIEEVPSGVRTITGVATSITAFVGSTLRGPVNEPVTVTSFADYVRRFGTVDRSSAMGYAVSQFYANGGQLAVIVRVVNGGNATTITADTLNLVAASVGTWGDALRVSVDHNTRPEVGTEELFNLSVEDTATGAQERFTNVSVLADHPRFVTTVLEQESDLIRVNGLLPGNHPGIVTNQASNLDGADSGQIGSTQVSDRLTLQPLRQGIWALDGADLINLLCIPPFSLDPAVDVDATTRSEASTYCVERRAMFIADPLSSWSEAADVIDSATGLDGVTWGLATSADLTNTAVFFPKLRIPDPQQEGRLADYMPCGVVAGIMARTDAQRGVWKAPAGLDASLRGVSALTFNMTDDQNGQLNPVGVNCLRVFPVNGRVVWGSRTMAGADQLASEWKYIPVRRTALFIEESLYRGTQWVVFEPNDEPLWAQIRLNVGAFMQNLFRQGAFQGSSPKDAYFVKCDSETTTQNDINSGIVNILVGFAPLKPAEFVVIKLQQMAGQVEV